MTNHRPTLAGLALAASAVLPYTARAQQRTAAQCGLPGSVVSVTPLALSAISKDRTDTTFVPLEDRQLQLVNLGGKWGQEGVVTVDGASKRLNLYEHHNGRITAADTKTATYTTTRPDGSAIVDVERIYKERALHRLYLHFLAQLKVPDTNQTVRGMPADIVHPVCYSIPLALDLTLDRRAPFDTRSTIAHERTAREAQERSLGRRIDSLSTALHREIEIRSEADSTFTDWLRTQGTSIDSLREALAQERAKGPAGNYTIIDQLKDEVTRLTQEIDSVSRAHGKPYAHTPKTAPRTPTQGTHPRHTSMHATPTAAHNYLTLAIGGGQENSTIGPDASQGVMKGTVNSQWAGLAMLGAIPTEHTITYIDAAAGFVSGSGKGDQPNNSGVVPDFAVQGADARLDVASTAFHGPVGVTLEGQVRSVPSAFHQAGTPDVTARQTRTHGAVYATIGDKTFLLGAGYGVDNNGDAGGQASGPAALLSYDGRLDGSSPLTVRATADWAHQPGATGAMYALTGILDLGDIRGVPVGAYVNATLQQVNAQQSQRIEDLRAGVSLSIR